MTPEERRDAARDAILAFLEHISAIGVEAGIVSLTLDDSEEAFLTHTAVSGESEALRIALSAALEKIADETDGDQIIDKAYELMAEGIPTSSGEVRFPDCRDEPPAPTAEDHAIAEAEEAALIANGGRAEEDLQRSAEAHQDQARFDRAFGGDDRDDYES